MNELSPISSDDEMVDIHVEDSLSRETLMDIDSVGRSITLEIVSLSIIFVIGMVSAILGPPRYNYHIKQVRLNQLKNGALGECSYELKNLAPSNLNLQLSVYLSQEISSISYAVASINFSFNYMDQDKIFRNKNRLVPSLLFYHMLFTLKTCSLLIIDDPLIDYSDVQTNIQIDTNNADFQFATFIYTMQNSDFTKIQAAFKCFFFIIEFSYLLSLLYSLRKSPYKIWHLEQKITMPLLVFGILANNPLFCLHIFKPMRTFVYYDQIVASQYQVYLIYFTVILFDPMKYKYKNLTSSFLTAKILFFAIFAFLNFFLTIFKINSVFVISNGITYHILGIVKLILYGSSIVMAFSTYYYATKTVDITESHRLRAYSNIYSILIGTHAAVFLINYFYCIWNKSANNNSAVYISNTLMVNFFVILMVCNHKPESSYDHYKRMKTEDLIQNNSYFVFDEEESGSYIE